ncbi:hypothetical protein EAO75_44705 [Streptomyces sp. uw30]|nr:hypothetical protein EAO75_44705 [Streptomyces sp. uw30]
MVVAYLVTKDAHCREGAVPVAAGHPPGEAIDRWQPATWTTRRPPTRG